MSPAPLRVLRSIAGDGYAVREIEYAAGFRQAPHLHESDGITVLIAGAIRETAAGREEVASCLSVVVKPAGVVHADQVGPRGARTLQVLLDPDFGVLRPSGEGGLGPWRWIHAGAGTRGLLSLLRALREADGQGGATVEDRVLEILDEATGADASVRRDPPAWLRRARESLDDRVGEGVRVRDLAAEAGVHPVSLARAFRRQYGASVSEYRRRARLHRAAAAIERSDWDLTRIAHAHGYVDHSHMCREVRATTGLTPSELRGLAGRSRRA
ncbi:MAG TPA: AraC family transcriptional regulator [Gemmatimonadota bacterium]|nr:AraC family transcriptional regulator [Gemmatimonadota bacterium]